MTASDWSVERRRGTVAELHAAEPPDPFVRSVWWFEPSGPALVLGSTQATSAARPGPDHTVRRSGGGAVLVDPVDTVWVDVLVPRGDPLWDDDVNRSFHWVGEVWVAALAARGIDAEVHRGALDRTPWSRLVCFAALGPGEVTVAGRKAVGLSQRRTRQGARFQCVAYVGDADPAAVVDLLAEPHAAGEREALRAHLAATTTALAVDAAALVDALLDALPSAPPV